MIKDHVARKTPQSTPLKRHAGNPILKPEDMPVDCFAVYNGGAVKVDGQYILLLRVEDRARRQQVWAARSDDGFSFTPDPEPVVFEASDMARYLEYADHSFYDPRINTVEGEYYITYAAASKYHGCRIGLGVTKDFRTIQHLSFPLHGQNRNAVLFPEKIDGMYVMLHRPQLPNGEGDIWISRSPDLQFWGDTECLARRGSGRWDSLKIGAGCPPIKTSEGWLLITHAVCGTCAGHYYTMGAVLLDVDDSSRVIGRSKGYILKPETEYETRGFVPNVVFPAGAVVESDGEVKIYYGAADNYECLATGRLGDLVDSCR